MRVLAPILALVASSGAVRAQSPWQPAAGHVQVRIWPGAPPDARPHMGRELAGTVLTAGKPRLVGGKPWTYVDSVSQPTMTVYSPTTGNTGTAVVVFPGGGYNVLAIDLEGSEACDWLVSKGITCVLLKYRVPCVKTGPYRDCLTALQDAQRTLGLLRSQASRYHVDPRRIGVLGFSAGGHMVVTTSTHLERLYKPVDAADSVSCRPDFAIALYPGHIAVPERGFAMNPDLKVTSATPPTLLIQAEDDPVDPVENSLVYHAALRRAHVPVELHLFVNGGHAFGLRRTGAPITEWPQIAERWMQRIGMLRDTTRREPPLADFHQHLFSPAAAALVTGNPNSPGISARDVVALLDSAGIRQALVLSVAYTWGKASRTPVANEYDHVKAENDWTAQQVAQYPDRLVAFCSFNPLKEYALDELARCSRDPQLRRGLKLHFGNSDVDLDNPTDVARTREVFAAANRDRMPIVVHMHTSHDKQRKYGADQARVFLTQLLPAAPDVPVQVAHLAGSGGYDDETDAALGVLADAMARHDPAVRRLWFDAATVVRPEMSDAQLQRVASRIRQVGIDRVLYGSDAAVSPAAFPAAGWAAFRRLPLTDEEFSRIAGNVAPYMK